MTLGIIIFLVSLFVFSVVMGAKSTVHNDELGKNIYLLIMAIILLILAIYWFFSLKQENYFYKIDKMKEKKNFEKREYLKEEKYKKFLQFIEKDEKGGKIILKKTWLFFNIKKNIYQRNWYISIIDIYEGYILITYEKIEIKNYNKYLNSRLKVFFAWKINRTREKRVKDVIMA